MYVGTTVAVHLKRIRILVRTAYVDPRLEADGSQKLPPTSENINCLKSTSEPLIDLQERYRESKQHHTSSVLFVPIHHRHFVQGKPVDLLIHLYTVHSSGRSV
jgi:hypothetical protein